MSNNLEIHNLIEKFVNVDLYYANNILKYRSSGLYRYAGPERIEISGKWELSSLEALIVTMAAHLSLSINSIEITPTPLNDILLHLKNKQGGIFVSPVRGGIIEIDGHPTWGLSSLIALRDFIVSCIGKENAIGLNQL